MSNIDSGVGFLPTHRVPAEGLATYPEPIPSAKPGPRLESSLEVQVLEQRDDGWAQILCSNGWTTWGDGRLLQASPRFVPASGMMTFSAPDPSRPPGDRLGPGLDVSVIEQRTDGWAHVRCSNGWTTWADGRLLLSAHPAAAADGPVPAPTAHAPTAQARGAMAAHGGRRVDRGGPGYAGSITAGTADELYTRWLPLVAGALILVGSFIPWFRVLGTSVSSWKVSLLYLMYVDTDAQPHVGLVLALLAALTILYAVVPLMGGRPLHRRVLLVSSWLTIEVPVLAIQRLLHHNTGVGLSAGPFLVMAGAGLAYLCFWRTRPVGLPGRWSWL